MRGNQLLHFLDRTVLKLLLRILCLFPSKEIDLSKTPNAIAVAKLTGIGDLILLTGSLQAIQIAYPDARKILYLGKENAALADLLPLSNWDIVILDISKPLRNLREIRKRPCDIYVDFGQWSRYEALLARLSGAKRRLGFDTPNQHRAIAYTETVLHSNSCHEVENFDRLSRIFCPVDFPMPTLSISSNMDRPFPIEYRDTERSILFHPWASGLTPERKEWAISNWVELAKQLDAAGYKIYISGSSMDRAKQALLFESLRENNVAAIDLCGKLSLAELASFLVSHKNLNVVCINTGIMHMVAALKIKVIALHGPTNPMRWGPVGDQHSILQPQDNPYTACLNLGFEYPDDIGNIVHDIQVETVLAEIEKLTSS